MVRAPARMEALRKAETMRIPPLPAPIPFRDAPVPPARRPGPGIRHALAAALLLLAPPARADAPAPPLGRWLAEDIRGGGVMDRLQSTLEVRPGGRVAGSGGCNRYAGTVQLAGDAMSFGPLVSTRMACPPAAMNQEQKFLGALAAVRSWRVDPARRKLILSDAAGTPILVFAAQPDKEDR